MNSKMINGSKMVLECLKKLGVKDIFGYPGGAVIPIYDEIYKFNGINHYFVRHEQGAAHAADGYARVSGKPGVCIATSGPGATNLVTGIMTAQMDSIPLIAITGQVPSALLGKDAFQESDIIGITMPITKNNYLVTDIKEIPKIFKEAFYIATTGRPGPVLIDIPRNIQVDEMRLDEFKKLLNEKVVLESYEPTYKGHSGQIKKAIKAINEAKKPMIISGAGVLKSKSSKEILELAKRIKAPVTTTLLGLGSVPSKNELSLGMLGMHGTVAANYATAASDLVIAAGIRFDDRITGNTKEFCKQAKIIHIDIDPAEISKNVRADIPIVGDLKLILKEILPEIEKVENKKWFDLYQKWKKDYPLVYKKKKSSKLLPQEIIEKIDEFLDGDAIISTDVGQHQMWAAQYFNFKNPDYLCTSGGAGTMGYGLPAAIGAQVAKKDTKVISISGDGGFQMTFQELMMMKEYNLPVKAVIINNSYLGMVRQWQEIFNDKRYSSVILDYNPDFIKIAEAYGLKGVKIESEKDFKKLEEAIKSDEPVVIECIVSREVNVYPMIPSGGTVNQMVGKKGELE